MFIRTSCKTSMRTQCILQGQNSHFPILHKIIFVFLFSFSENLSQRITTTMILSSPPNFPSIKTSSQPSPAWFLTSSSFIPLFHWFSPYKLPSLSCYTIISHSQEGREEVWLVPHCRGQRKRRLLHLPRKLMFFYQEKELKRLRLQQFLNF